jgi:hypothetical protein
MSSSNKYTPTMYRKKVSIAKPFGTEKVVESLCMNAIFCCPAAKTNTRRR